ncbi:hypothetical protein [Ideonella sp.]|jgi:hypothetical protein|uniref:hypothetical protein n=1 Tax=Ideonella sp. TaxID=1929293 RepID=UPI0037BF8F30
MDTPTSAHPTRPLKLPFTGQALRQAVAQRDIRLLMNAAHQLRIAGFSVDPQRLAEELLSHGCVWLTDPFGQRVPLYVQVPEAAARQQVDQSVPFRISA